MPVSLQNVVPWGRSLDEYRLMFALTDGELGKKILGCGDGPASFNAEMTRSGKPVRSVDPIYTFSGEEIASRFEASAGALMEQVRASMDSWVWKYHRDPEHLIRSRRKTLGLFLEDYERGKAEGRYEVGELPSLGYADNAFDLALCSHFLFLYSEHFPYEFHLSSVLELCRVAREVRIFPTMTLKQRTSPYVEGILGKLRGLGFDAEIRTVGYEFQRNGNQAIFIRKPG